MPQTSTTSAFVPAADSHDAIVVVGAHENNLRGVSVRVPKRRLTVFTGVSGSGKSSLVHGHLSPMEGVVTLDQSPIKGSRRSSPATYTGLLDPVRKAFAKAGGVKPALFSSNSEGACPVCHGAGVIDTQLGFMETVTTVCEACEGRRYDDEVLAYRFGGHNIAEVLAMSVDEALTLFSAKETRVSAAVKILTHMHDAGLGYLRLGQAVSTLSGGERQRLRLAVHLGQDGDVLVLDEPTVGLHLADVEEMLALLDHLVESGRTVVVIEHHQAVMARADWIIDMGPGAGREGGQVVFTGTPAELVASGSTLTGEYLARYVAG
ncbi:ATP-binding cassette domain-containing protein [Actinomyces faecalis]|uniref:ATP-binding cassette domain-containing protein n=1 Tax=Actinomyces faecalis TaxID=2722820 RepID=UPI002E2C32B0|nr:ATP-binding cassette domain-containing protein [Actinomyces faecalis]